MIGTTHHTMHFPKLIATQEVEVEEGDEAQEYAEANGVDFSVFPMPGGATDFTAELTQALDAGVEYILVQNVSSPASTLVKNVRDFGLDATVICLNWCSDELFVSLAGDAGEGVLGTSPFAFPGSGAAGLQEMEDYLDSQGGNLADKGIRYVQGWLTMKVLTAAIEEVVSKVLANCSAEVAAYKSGKTKLLGFFVGRVMQETRGKANPKLVNEILKKKLAG